MRKYFILITLAIVVVLVFIIVHSTKKIQNELDTISYSSLLDMEGNEIVPVTDHVSDIKEIPSFMSSYSLQTSTTQIDKHILNDHPIKKLLFNSFLDSRYTEEEMLSVIVNQLYFDNGVMGLPNAASYYFSKKSTELTIAEQIFLIYKSNHDESKDISKDLLAFIDDQAKKGLIDSVEVSKKEVERVLDEIKNPRTLAQSYVQLVIKEMVEKMDMPEQDLFRKGYHIQTNLKPEVQMSLSTTFSNDKLFPDLENIDIEAGMAIINYHTGKITGLIGGRDFQTSTYNRATDTTRQPASTLKPLLVYGPAVELGWKKDDLLKDTPMKIGDFIPRNYDGKYHGEVTLQESLTMSYNVPTTWLLNEIGLETGLDYINKLNLFTVDAVEGYKLALGYTDTGSSPLALAEAYSVFANKGKFIEASTIESIKTKNGKVIFEYAGEEKRIFEEKTADTITTMLEDVVKNGTGKEAYVKGQTIAGKTGTTSYDGWFVGFDDTYVGAIWLGPDEVIPENRMNIDGGGYPATLFQKVFSQLHE
jgi:penicillin-binding protein 2A